MTWSPRTRPALPTALVDMIGRARGPRARPGSVFKVAFWRSARARLVAVTLSVAFGISVFCGTQMQGGQTEATAATTLLVPGRQDVPLRSHCPLKPEDVPEQVLQHSFSSKAELEEYLRYNGAKLKELFIQLDRSLEIPAAALTTCLVDRLGSDSRVKLVWHALVRGGQAELRHGQAVSPDEHARAVATHCLQATGTQTLRATLPAAPVRPYEGPYVLRVRSPKAEPGQGPSLASAK
jgi:hypothetical protein